MLDCGWLTRLTNTHIKIRQEEINKLLVRVSLDLIFLNKILSLSFVDEKNVIEFFFLLKMISQILPIKILHQ